jgi:hypothetical protein
MTTKQRDWMTNAFYVLLLCVSVGALIGVIIRSTDPPFAFLVADEAALNSPVCPGQGVRFRIAAALNAVDRIERSESIRNAATHQVVQRDDALDYSGIGPLEVGSVVSRTATITPTALLPPGDYDYIQTASGKLSREQVLTVRFTVQAC